MKKETKNFYSFAPLYWQVGFRVDGLAVHQQAEIQMGAVGDAGAADNGDFLADGNMAFTFGDGGRQAAEVGIERDIGAGFRVVVLDQYFQPAHSALVHGNHVAVGGGPDGTAGGR